MSRLPDLIATIEACYRVEQPSDDWLRNVIESLHWLDDGIGIFGFTYTLSPSFELDAGPIVQVGCPPQIREALHIAFQNGAQFNQAAYLSSDAGAASLMPGFAGSENQLRAHERGVVDSWGINGRNWDRRNAVIIINRTALKPPSPERIQLLKRLAIHLAAGARLQRRLEAAEREACVEAVLTPQGKVEHAQGDARERDTLRELAHATIARESARGALRHEQPEQAVSAWQGRVAARWSLVDRFERDGKRYVIARENEPAVAGLADLSSRERQVVASAALGRTNKEIGYDLGLADSTVRVLLARAAKKLGVNERSQAIEKFLSFTS